MKLALSKKEQTNLVYDLYLKGNGLLAKNNMEFSKRYYLRILTLKNKGVSVKTAIYADILHNLAMIAENKHEYESAIKYYQQSVMENPQRSMTWLFLARLLFERFQDSNRNEDYQLAVNALKQVDIEKNNLPVINYLKIKYNIA